MNTEARPAATARDRDTRSVFERFVEVAQGAVARPHTLVLVFLLVGLWGLSYPVFHEVAEWHATLHSTLAVLSLVLLVLLENAGRRDAQASQEKLNLVSEALVTLLESHADQLPDGRGQEALRSDAERLRTAVGLEDRH